MIRRKFSHAVLSSSGNCDVCVSMSMYIYPFRFVILCDGARHKVIRERNNVIHYTKASLFHLMSSINIYVYYAYIIFRFTINVAIINNDIIIDNIIG